MAAAMSAVAVLFALMAALLSAAQPESTALTAHFDWHTVPISLYPAESLEQFAISGVVLDQWSNNLAVHVHGRSVDSAWIALRHSGFRPPSRNLAHSLRLDTVLTF
jgi:hypothetical protein